MSQLNELLERVRKATGPDRELEIELWLAFEPGASRKQWSYVHTATGRHCDMDETRDGTGRLIVVPCLSGSVDCALALVARVLPLFAIQRLTYWPINPTGDAKHSYSTCEIYGVREDGWHNHENGRWEGKGRTPTLAILAALLTALIAKESA